MTDDVDLEARVDEAFPRALSHYSRYLLIHRPVVDYRTDDLARIDLTSRAIRLGAKNIVEYGLEDCLEAVIAHVIGHHVGFPGSPVVHARLLLLERTFLPKVAKSMTGPLYELLIDERLGRVAESQSAMRDSLCTMLAARAKRSPEDALFLFQCSVVEEMWQRPEGEILGQSKDDFDDSFPHHRLGARLVAQNLFGYAPDLTLQFLYFASIAFPFAIRTRRSSPQTDEGTVDQQITDEQWAEALTPKKSEKAAIERAIEEKFFPDKLAEALRKQDMSQRAAGMPGDDKDQRSSLITNVMAAHYRREAERYLFTPPPIASWSEALVPTTLEEWEPGEAVSNIDWQSTLLMRGEVLGSALPLVRERIADEEGFLARSFEGRTEIYLDVSGSMPDPTKELNAMTLAAQILATGTLRAGGSARALLYSSTYEAAWEYCRSETILSKFLMRYIGGGTDFPFEVLAESVEKQRGRQPIRVIITDSDFDMNYDHRSEHARIFRRATENSPALVLLLHAPSRDRVRLYEQAGARVVPVRTLSDFPHMAAALAHSLFDSGATSVFEDEPEVDKPIQKDKQRVVPKKLGR